MSRHWSIRDLATIGIIAALARALGLMTVFLGGGMNPVSLTLRAMVITVLFIILRTKVRRFGTLCLAALIGALTSFMFMAQGMIMTLPLLLLAALAAELAIRAGGGSLVSIVLGVGLMQIMDKAASLGFIYLNMREMPAMMWPLLIMIALSAVGDVLGCLIAPRFIKELRHAGFICGQ